MIKWIGRPILLSLVVAASVLTTTAVASAAGTTSTTTVTQTSPVGPAVVGQPVTSGVSVAGPSGARPRQAPSRSPIWPTQAVAAPPWLWSRLAAATSTAATASCTTTYTKTEGPSTSPRPMAVTGTTPGPRARWARRSRGWQHDHHRRLHCDAGDGPVGRADRHGQVLAHRHAGDADGDRGLHRRDRRRTGGARIMCHRRPVG